jgi:hypothetical protein
VLPLIALCVLLAGCSSSPSSGDGERAIQTRIDQQSQGRIKLAKFEKTNGAQGEMSGFKIYALEFAMEIEIAEDCKWLGGRNGEPLSFQTSKPVAQAGSGFSWNSFADATMNPGTLVKRGQRIKLTGVMHFVKKERGWDVDEIELTQVDIGAVPTSASAGESSSAGVQSPTVAATSVPVQAGEEVLKFLADVERDYFISATPLPTDGGLAPLFRSGGIQRIQFSEPDLQHGKIKAVIRQTVTISLRNTKF